MASWMRPVVPTWASPAPTVRALKSPSNPVSGSASVPADSHGVKSTFAPAAPATPAAVAVPHQFPDAFNVAVFVFTTPDVLPAIELLNTVVPVRSDPPTPVHT